MSIYFGKPDENKYDHATLYNMFRFRHRIFHDRLQWDVNSLQGMEYDEFDTLNPYHMIGTDQQDQVEACWRFLPTTGPYMLKDTFPQLLCGEQAPQQKDIWELSRFAVAPASDKSTSQAMLNELTFRMLQLSYDFAIEHNISQYVTVTSAALERVLLHAGFPLQRIGNGQSQKIGKVTTVACRVPVNEQYRKAAFSSGENQQAA